ncbi:endoribonuclease L-PSP [Seminavis robusta]|uniref:Endoribonuclease L-PSP n=1 Tax=Seminavis robusta TaxID=568900 RepID=A0A9N8ELR3_9STRA|nr:endoribonuclease L-PSP [Seminavis robusta]|eukprot:Sro1326_g263000.1 endoribonuclease L-PSP (208) ;mRNA; f:12306-12929
MMRYLLLLSLATLITCGVSAFQPALSLSHHHHHHNEISSSLLQASSNSVHDTLKELDITLPPAPPAAANYLPCQRSGNLLFLSGHMPLLEDGTTLITGVCQSDDDINAGYKAARQVGLNLIATLNKELDGDLDRVAQIVKLFGIVQSTPDFKSQHKVLNGCSDLMGQVFGPERGVHSRSAIGTNALPLNLMVEIEAIVEITAEEKEE